MDQELDSLAVPESVRRLPSWLLGQAARIGRRLAREGLAAYDVGLLDYLVLAALTESGTQTQAELVRTLPVDGSDMAAVLTNLERLGFVRRRRDPADARRKLVVLTELGRRRQPHLAAILDQSSEALLEPLTARESAELLRLLAKLVTD